MAVSADHAPIQSQIPGAEGGNSRQLSGHKVALHNAVLLKKQAGNVQLHPLTGGVILEGHAADENVQLFSLDSLHHRQLHLILGQMGQQIGDAEDGLISLLTNGDIHGGAIPLDDHAVKG